MKSRVWCKNMKDDSNIHGSLGPKLGEKVDPSSDIRPLTSLQYGPNGANGRTEHGIPLVTLCAKLSAAPEGFWAKNLCWSQYFNQPYGHSFSIACTFRLLETIHFMACHHIQNPCIESQGFYNISQWVQVRSFCQHTLLHLFNSKLYSNCCTVKPDQTITPHWLLYTPALMKYSRALKLPSNSCFKTISAHKSPLGEFKSYKKN